MTPGRPHLTAADLAPLARAAAGPRRTLAGVTRMRGGSKKGSYRLTYDDGSTAIAYVWSPAENYWDRWDGRDDPQAAAGPRPPDPRAPFSPATGTDLFTAAHDRLTAAGVRTPRLLLVDPDRRYLPADAVVVENVRGGSLAAALARDPAAAGPIVDRLAGQLRALHAHDAPPLPGFIRSASGFSPVVKRI
ncbi:Phosphotransferase enzyme family protein [Streptomyces sp. yr375]|uniref:phosphotransferase n=1 Tax=Streptomyces sp. yr375 TaxID=1761906 RepID=UPI0008B3ACA4|nr:phosphotransferase [Streptomyces sp. yr375]SES49747.1 Phosphotransferase enzyme family protein [Streptomyces sp. yr375]